jgi:ribosomal protein S18 acetylase RimI-like enzyme
MRRVKAPSPHPSSRGPVRGRGVHRQAMIIPYLPCTPRLPHRAAGAPVVALLPSDNVIVRELRGEDVWPMASLLRTTFAAESNPASGIAIVAEHILGIRKRRSTNLILVATAEETGEVVGSVECFTSTFLSSQLGNDYPDRIRLLLRPYLASLAVRADARRCGVASSLVCAVEDRVVSGPPPHILTLEVEDGDEPAIALYRKLGYTFVRREEGRRLDGDMLFGKSVKVNRLRYEKDLRECDDNSR